MKRYIIASTCMLAAAMMALTSCSDPDDEITSLIFGRNFAPLSLEASNVKETSASISWNPSAGATSYTLEVYADDSLTFAGTPVQVIQNLTRDDIPYTVDGLLFDTQYSVRVQALTEGDASRTSRWNGAYFKTGTKQYLKNPKAADISDRSVVLMWEVEEGYDVTTIVVGNITHQITDEEKAAGQATISGLEPETSYTAYLYYNGKQCGNRNFTTIADLEGAILVHDTDNLKNLLENASAGDVFALMGGTYLLNTNDNGQTGAVKISQSITVKGIYPSDKPVIKGRFELNDGAGFTLSQVVIDGRNNATADQIFNYKTADANYGPLEILNCEVTGQATGKGLVYLNVKSIVESITIQNSIVYGIQCSGGDFIDSRTGLPRKVTLSNSTFYNCATARDFIRIDNAAGSFEGEAGPLVTVDHCTLYRVGYTEGAQGANYRMLYVRYAENKITFTNNIVVETNYRRGFSDQAATDQEPTLNNNFYYNCENLTSEGAGANNPRWYDSDDEEKGKGNGTVLTASPFVNAVPDFTLNSDGAAFKAGAGDPRWLQ